MPSASKGFVPTSQYQRELVEGWTVYVNKSLRGEQGELGARALRLLELKLFEITRAVPPKALGELRKVPIWLGVNDGRGLCAEYHGGPDWLRQNGYNPDKAWSVELGNAGRFLDWTQAQPSIVLHELAHAYFDRLPAHARKPVEAAFAEARELGVYDRVLHTGGGRVPHYALTDVGEFFAEGSEAFFGTNDHYPFVRAELHEHHPAFARALSLAWSHHDGPSMRTEPTGMRVVRVQPMTAGTVLPPSSRSTRKLEVGLVNASSVDLQVAWVDPNGKQQEPRPLPSGDGTLLETYAGHTFVLSARGRSVGLIVVPTESGRASITEELVRSLLEQTDPSPR